jgi:hypothetical protein
MNLNFLFDIFVGVFILGALQVLIPLLLGLPGQLWSGYNSHVGNLDARSAALHEASTGAAMIVFAVLIWLRLGRFLPAWCALVALAVVIWGALRLHHGAKFSVGGRDPKLIVRAAVKIALGVLLFRAIGARQFGDLAPLVYALLSYVGWWLLVTGITKLVLVLRGFPAPPWDTQNPDMPHGDAGFF